MNKVLRTGNPPSRDAKTVDPRLESIARDIERLQSDAVLAIAAKLVEAREIFRYRRDEGGFTGWVERRLSFSKSTAYKLLDVHARFDGDAKSFHIVETLPRSVLYLLSAPSVPPEARDAIIERAQDGEPISAADVRQTIDRARRGVTGVAMRPHTERGLDLYETPAAAVHALLDVEPLSGTIWEPACGPGNIVKVLRTAGHQVIATDIKSYGCPDSLGGIDFLTQNCAPGDAEVVVTNPPFMHADDFVRQALKLVPRVVMLLRFLFAESVSRNDILDAGQLVRVHVFRSRLQIHRDGWPGPHKSNQIAMAWFVWDRHHHGPTELRRISWEPGDAASVAPPAQAAE